MTKRSKSHASTEYVTLCKRPKKRYFLTEFIFTSAEHEKQFKRYATESKINEQLKQHFVNYWGVMGGAMLNQQTSFRVIYFNKETHICMFRVARPLQQMFESITCFLTTCEGVPCSLRVLHIAGTVRKIKRVAVEYHLESIKHLTDSDDEVDQIVADTINIINANQ
jgi:ribonuclease P/MRP protein subunit POP5